jgi:hypothetical protein
MARSALMLLFLALFTFQISGLSCLEEWAISPAASTLSQEPSALSDDCPCHFTFVSSPSLGTYRNGLITRAAVRPPTTYAFDTHLLPFRPPAFA